MASSSIENRTKAVLQLEDGSLFEGISFGAERDMSGECVFQTGMVGYVESLTDPSYKGQLLILTYPLIGNYGVPADATDPKTGIPAHSESGSIHVSALLVAYYSDVASHWNSVKTLSQWLIEQNVPALYNIDTRALTKKIRDKGSTLARITMIKPGTSLPKNPKFDDPNKVHLVAQVSSKECRYYSSSDFTPSKTIIAIDCGMKWNQVRCLVKRGVRVKVVPWNHDFSKEQGYDGVFISNGPGDPTFCEETIKQIRYLLQQKKTVPVFGICLGHQLMALAAGAKTFKMKFGNRGQNQPCVDLKTGRCHLTMQNHGYAVDPSTLPQEWEQYFVNANDGTNEGIIHKEKPFFSVQFHPEAKGGPIETEYPSFRYCI